MNNTAENILEPKPVNYLYLLQDEQPEEMYDHEHEIDADFMQTMRLSKWMNTLGVIAAVIVVILLITAGLAQIIL